MSKVTNNNSSVKRSVPSGGGVSDEEDFAGFEEDNLTGSNSHQTPRPPLKAQKKMKLNDSEPKVAVAPVKSKGSPIIRKNYNDPLFRKPFEHQWKRELVIRFNPNDSKQKERGDVYYITPSGKRVRTKQEIMNNLFETPELSIENFTFSKDPVGGNPEDEIIRHANSNVAKRTPTTADAFIQAQAQAKGLLPDMGKRTPKPKLPKGASPPPPGASISFTKSVVKTVLPKEPAAAKQSQNGVEPKPVPKLSGKIKKHLPCTITCVKAMGTIPHMQCKKCCCLYHPECARERSKAPVDFRNFLCQDCKEDVEKPVMQKSSNQPNFPGSKLKDLNKMMNREAPPQSIAVIAGRKYIVVSRSLTISDERPPSESRFISPTTLSSSKPSSAKKELSSSPPATSLPPASKQLTREKRVPSAVVNSSTAFSMNFFRNVSMGYDILLHIFQYLKVQELLRCGCVCRLWNQAANNYILWKTVRMKNSLVTNWTGLANTLQHNNSRHLDLKKMLIASDSNEMWLQFSNNVGTVENLRSIDFCRCPAWVVEKLFESNRQLEAINAVTINSTEIDLTHVRNMRNLRELRLRSTDSVTLTSGLTPLRDLANMRHLSLTSVSGLGKLDVSILGTLLELESLELGECSEFSDKFASGTLSKLVKLEKLRLEKCQQPCSSGQLIDTIAELPNLTQLELINFDISLEFEDKIAACTSLRRMLLIPTYIQQSATTNKVVLAGISRLSSSLQSFIWVVTTELLKVTDLYIEEGRRLKNESIPVLKPLPFQESTGTEVEPSTVDIPSEIEIVPLSSIESMLKRNMPETRIKILKVPLSSTWKQSILD